MLPHEAFDQISYDEPHSAVIRDQQGNGLAWYTPKVWRDQEVRAVLVWAAGYTKKEPGVTLHVGDYIFTGEDICRLL